ncbi:hypothetical protein [Symbiopectobacterium purcellii]|uniref:Pectate lyase domain-containing protein n=1 Tax=Symbiopectobacterium purcellii TaxID=2871826 RepID=A0ABX9AMX0_9ENTR|nr:hypothetical protein [Symbiopectobacterium purcellii]QZN96349.1 hypothetical protein K6K13_02430 [Symbiopectobacterium purcellii]QZN96428.1 hypothetical protein K6K13_02885 [Symbiopectobacterium purcellii]
MFFLNKKLLINLSLLLASSNFSAYADDTGGYSNTVGGDSEPAVLVKTLSELEDAVYSGKHHIVIDGVIYGGAGLTTILFASTANNNTTIEGAPGGKAALENIQLKFDGELLPLGTNIENIKISNLNFYGRISDLQAMPKQVVGDNDSTKTAGINYEGISLRRVSNALITHCNIYDISDDLISITMSSDNVTLSYNHFYFNDDWVNMQPNPVWNWVGNDSDLAGERLAMLVGYNHDDSWLVTKLLHVTIHHNWIGPNMRGRPLLRGWVHVYSNYFDNSKTYSATDYNIGTDGHKYPKKQYDALQINSGSIVYSESNYFLSTNNTNKISEDSSGYSYQFFEKNNIYSSITGQSATGINFNDLPVSYSYTVTDSESVPEYVMANAGPVVVN